MRFLSAQWVGMLENGAWLRHAAHANGWPPIWKAKLAALPGVRVAFPREANAVFALLPHGGGGRGRRPGMAFLQRCGPRRRGAADVRVGLDRGGRGRLRRRSGRRARPIKSAASTPPPGVRLQIPFSDVPRFPRSVLPGRTDRFHAGQLPVLPTALRRAAGNSRVRRSAGRRSAGLLGGLRPGPPRGADRYATGRVRAQQRRHHGCAQILLQHQRRNWTRRSGSPPVRSMRRVCGTGTAWRPCSPRATCTRR